MTIFGVSWDELALEHIEAFLADAGDEGLTWEAKGTERPHPASVRKHVSGFANAIGGFYLVGVSGAPGAWNSDGVDFDGDEPAVWLGNVIRNGLRPVPRYDVKEWPIGGRILAAVHVDPVAEPPCMTSSGEIFERVSGETIRVTDPSILRRLFERGEGAAAEAERIATRSMERIVLGQDGDAPRLAIELGFAPTGKPADVGRRLFAPSFAEHLANVFEELPPSPLFDELHARRAYDLRIAQSSHSAIGTQGRERWSLVGRWDASAAVFLDVTPADEEALLGDSVFADAVRPAADAAAQLVHEIGGYGRAHVVLRLGANRMQLAHGDYRRRIPHSSTPTARTWTGDDGLLSDDALDRMKRDILRACRIPVYEPED